MTLNGSRSDPQSAAEKAVAVIGSGYNLCNDIRLTTCKSMLIDLDSTRTRDLVIPGGPVVPDVSTSIRCDKGERTRFRSDVVSFNQMSEQYNKEVSLSGKILSGLFNAMFNFTGCWQKDAAPTKALAFNVPSTWDPAALAEFIDKYGTHIVVGVKMGGKDIVHLKQLQNSNLHPTEVQKLLKQLADEMFSEDATGSESDHLSGKMKDDDSMPREVRRTYAAPIRPPTVKQINDGIITVCVRRGGVDIDQSHNKWLSIVSQSPNVISMSFVPITSLLGGVQGIGFLSHAVNLYLRYKPPIEELQLFLEYQLPRQWAPVYGDLPLGLRRRKQVSPSLQFTFMGPKLYVNTLKVDTGNRPVTGMRLYLEGKKSDHLAIHLQHLAALKTPSPAATASHSAALLSLSLNLSPERDLFSVLSFSLSKSPTTTSTSISPPAVPAVPEFLSSTPRSVDAYSFGLILYEMIEGIQPFHPKPIEESVKLMCLEGKRPQLRTKSKSYPLILKELIEECWDPEPVMRPIFSEIIVRLDRIVANCSKQGWWKDTFKLPWK
ncbi:hypothetical protein FF1_000398 [Malus domestica]